MNIDTALHWVRAEAAMRAQRWPDALANLRKLIQVVDRIDFEYEEWLRAMAEALRALGQFREAAACWAYLGSTEPPGSDSLVRLRKQVDEGDEDALRGVQLFAIYLARAGHHDVAAQWFDAAAMPLQRAIELERAGKDEQAAELWNRMIQSDRFGRSERGAPSEHPYELALARINYGLCLHRIEQDKGRTQTEPSRARMALAEATTAVEEVADRFETEGLRERAFDCYQLLARIGLETGAFENVAEGYLNSVRILRDDALKLDALRLYEAFVTLAKRSGEFHAVAGILREAADYCIRVGLPYGDDLRLRCGEAWVKAAEHAQAQGHPVQIVENAYLAAAEAYVSVRAFRPAGEVYSRVANLEIKGRERYHRLLDRLGRHSDDPPRPIPVPEFLKRLPDYEEVWYVDLAEWELDGNPALIAAGIMADRRFPDYVRRHALLLVLEVQRPGRAAPEPSRTGDAARTDIVQRLKLIRAYPVIAALERMYASGDPKVQREVAEALGALRFKRSFTTLALALRADDPLVRTKAADAIKNLYFPHAFDPLRRIFEARDIPDPESARIAAIHAIGRINTVEALDFLCDRLREGEPRYVKHVAAAISELTNADLGPYLRQQIDLVPPVYRSVLEDAAHRLG